MKVLVENTWITLTQQQINAIDKTKRELEKSVKSFESVLKFFGLKKVNTSDWENNANCLWYQHPDRNWCAEIIKHNTHWIEVFAAGYGLKHDTVPPGGWIYSTPEELKDAFLEALKKYATE